MTFDNYSQVHLNKQPKLIISEMIHIEGQFLIEPLQQLGTVTLFLMVLFCPLLFACGDVITCHHKCNPPFFVPLYGSVA